MLSQVLALSELGARPGERTIGAGHHVVVLVIVSVMAVQLGLPSPLALPGQLR